MSGFAERWVARAAGRPTGLPLLTPRPAARFEREMTTPVDTEVPAERPSEEPHPAATADRALAAAPPTREAQEGPGKSIEREAELETSKARPVSSAPQLPHTAMAVSRVQPPPPPATESPDQGSAKKSEPDSVRQKPMDDEAVELPPLFFEEPRAAIMGAIPQIERAPPPPTISIGRIDVQFLPQERPVAPARSEAQRTRGFEAYARARRGMPR
ncbi:hypothetical protein G5V57_20210 [Nordella sp. HKS 07]|uniref:hypothetical protein n=1 Tax=Nordella sp. HKS 07 TaxID=2712222 RepID=UPI0013E1EABF|nr:hypothetical protein [Nordella sp. HKS 07]QIG49838.1 hypothetical protein G5V57_20210 [Nordella sp. HKS 07]